MILFLVCIIYIIFNKKSDKEHMIDIPNIENPTWTRNKCNYLFNNTVKKVFDNYNVNNSGDENEWDIYLPCTYDDINQEINDIQISGKKNKRIFILNNADYVIGKDFLWHFMKKYHGIEKAKTRMPMTYLLDNGDKRDLINDYDDGKLYILKKNIQRQEGLKITDSLDEILDADKEDFVVAQELLQNPYLINGRKINLRMYILTICKNGDMDVYVYNDGFMYYTKDEFVKGSKDFGPNITTGYIDRSVYETNPLTHDDFRKYLDNPSREKSTIEKRIAADQRISDFVFSGIYKLLHDIYMSFTGIICGGKLDDNITFQLFGADIAIDDKLNPMVMEINKGPDMSAKDGRDGDVKYKCMRDIFDKLGVIRNDEKNNFTQILEYVKNN